MKPRRCCPKSRASSQSSRAAKKQDHETQQSPSFSEVQRPPLPVSAYAVDSDLFPRCQSTARPLPGPRAEGGFRLHVLLAHSCSARHLAPAQTLTGTVKNSTTGKPAAGDEVILISLGQGMEESGRTKADAKGNFSFKLDDPNSASRPRNSPGSHLPSHGASGNHFRRGTSLRCREKDRRHLTVVADILRSKSHRDNF